jgi:hypothetical protein
VQGAITSVTCLAAHCHLEFEINTKADLAVRLCIYDWVRIMLWLGLGCLVSPGPFRWRGRRSLPC